MKMMMTAATATTTTFDYLTVYYNDYDEDEAAQNQKGTRSASEPPRTHHSVLLPTSTGKWHQHRR